MADDKIYCCKVCRDGQIRKVMSANPCKHCTCVDNCDPCAEQAPGAGNETNTCPYGQVHLIDPSQQCPPNYRDEGVHEMHGDLAECIKDCRDKYTQPQAPPTGELNDCIQHCREQFGEETQSKRRCVCEGIKQNGEDGGETGGEGGECSNGYKLSDSPLAAEGGKVWTEDGLTAEMGFVRNSAHAAHWLYKDGKWYKLGDVISAINAGDWTQAKPVELPGMCKKGWQPKTINGEWMCCQEGGGGGEGGAGGMFNWSPELQNYFKRMMDRLSYLLDYPRGLTDEERQSIVNYALTGIQRQERGEMQSMRDRIARMGLLGSGFELREGEKIQRGTEEMKAQVRQGLAIDEINRRFQELMGTTSAAQGLMGLLMQGEVTPEQLNAARRAEGQQSLAMMLQFMQSMYGAGQGYLPSYLQALLTQGQLGSYGSSSGIGSWLPWLGYLFGNYFQKS